MGLLRPAGTSQDNPQKSLTTRLLLDQLWRRRVPFPSLGELAVINGPYRLRRCPCVARGLLCGCPVAVTGPWNSRPLPRDGSSSQVGEGLRTLTIWGKSPKCVLKGAASGLNRPPFSKPPFSENDLGPHQAGADPQKLRPQPPVENRERPIR